MVLLSEKPFQPMKLEEERDKDSLIFTVRLNKEEAQTLQIAKKIINQPKDSTAIKQLAEIGYKCITSPENSHLINIIFQNKRKNYRTGINEIE